MSLYRKNSNHEIVACITPEYTTRNKYTKAVHHIDNTNRNRSFSFQCYTTGGCVQYFMLTQVLDRTKIVRIDMSTPSSRIRFWQEYRRPFFRNENYKVDVPGRV